MNITAVHEAAIVALLEPERAFIEYKLSSDYDSSEHSWRDYRNAMWDYFERYRDRIKEVIESTQEQAMPTTLTNGVATNESLVPVNVMRQILTQEREAWQQHRARQMLGLELCMTITRELGVDKSAEVKGFEAKLSEALICIRVLDAKLRELPDDPQ